MKNNKLYLHTECAEVWGDAWHFLWARTEVASINAGLFGLFGADIKAVWISVWECVLIVLPPLNTEGDDAAETRKDTDPLPVFTRVCWSIHSRFRTYEDLQVWLRRYPLNSRRRWTLECEFAASPAESLWFMCCSSLWNSRVLLCGC